MRGRMLVAGIVLVAAACGSRSPAQPRGPTVPADPNLDVVVIEEGRGAGTVAGPRGLQNVPPGHYPPPGHCRTWYMGRPPGQQPPPERCEVLVGRVPLGAFLLFNGQAWDTEYDWRRHNAGQPDSVPDAVLRIMGALAPRR